MSKLSSLFLFALALTSGAQAQIKLMGVAPNNETNTVDLIQWSLFDEQSVVTIPTELEVYLYASSSYDPFNGSYYISGGTFEELGLYSYNTDTEASTFDTNAPVSNIAEFDMSTGNMYNLIVETEDYINVYEYDIEASEEVLIGTIYEPGVQGIVVDAISFDSNNGIIYYVGVPSDGPLALYAIPVREETFSFTKTDLITQTLGNVITGLNYDNVNDKLFATNNTYDEDGTFQGRAVIEIDYTSGEIETLGILEGFPYFLGGSSQFDQITGTYLLVGINTDNEQLMIAFNTNTNTYETGFVPSVSEIVCNNTLFARSSYQVAGVELNTASDIRAYPNPVVGQLNIEWTANGPVQLEVINALGDLVFSQNTVTLNRATIDMTAFASGLYTINLTSKDQVVSKKIVVQ
jgi:hypothetical protein